MSSSTTTAAATSSVLQSRRALYVGGLSGETNEATLRAAFIPFGPLKSVEMPMDYKKNQHRGFGFVEYMDPEDAEAAIDNMEGAELNGKTLSVSLAQPNQWANAQSHSSHQKAVWSNDEWFQQQQQKQQHQQEDTSASGQDSALQEPIAR